MKKMPFLLPFLSLLLLLSFTRCDKNEDPRLVAAAQEVGDIIDIFELKEDGSYSLNLANESYRLTVESIEDNVTVSCMLAYFEGGIIPETLRTYVTLKIEGAVSKTIKVQSSKCGAFGYRKGQSNIEDVKQILENDKASGQAYYIQQFFNHFDTGTVFTLGENIYKLYLAKSDPLLYLVENPYAPISYKFIFILTKIEDAL